MVNAERQRLDEADTRGVPWRRWGPYLSERQWGTAREDYGGGRDDAAEGGRPADRRRPADGTSR